MSPFAPTIPADSPQTSAGQSGLNRWRWIVLAVVLAAVCPVPLAITALLVFRLPMQARQEQ